MGKKKPRPKSAIVPASSNAEDIAETSSKAAKTAPVGTALFLKLCRLCETKDGPFLNIFGVEQTISQKMANLLPFTVSEYDDLPHKICFRCSAKVEECHDFIQKCIKTQENLQKAIGKTTGVPLKGKTRTVWEEILNQSNMSNDEICDAVIKQAMKGIVDLPPSPPSTESKVEKPVKKTEKKPVNVEPILEIKTETIESPAETKLRPRRSCQGPSNEQKESNEKAVPNTETQQRSLRLTDVEKLKDKPVKEGNASDAESNSSGETFLPKNMKNKGKKDKETPPFDIQKYVSTIKVNGVGTLHLCSLCNRNFLNHEVLMNHACAKTGVPKQDFMTKKTASEPAQSYKDPMSSVKYINNPPSDAKTEAKVETPRPKPKIGPASKVRKNEVEPTVGMKVVPKERTPPPAPTAPSFLPTIDIPGMNCRYRLVPGPNNSFTLLEDSEQSTAPTKRKISEEPTVEKKHKKDKKATNDVIDLDDDDVEASTSQGTPYPVGLIQANRPEPVPFTTPAMKKQSYTVVQTGNPSKLLISAKPQNPDPPQPKSKKKSKKEAPKEPYSVTLEDTSREKDTRFFTFVNVDPLLQPSYVLPTNNIIQESQISTSSAVAPSVADDKPYSCNLCSETFSREKKLLVHIQAHYNKMDMEDSIREQPEKRTSKKSRKS